MYVQKVPQPWMSVVVPAYNEEQTIAATVAAVRDWLEARRTAPTRSWWSTTPPRTARLRCLAPLLDDERIRLLRNDVNRGKGFSVRRGMLETQGQLRLLCDADCAPSLASLPAWWRPSSTPT